MLQFEAISGVCVPESLLLLLSRSLVFCLCKYNLIYLWMEICFFYDSRRLDLVNAVAYFPCLPSTMHTSVFLGAIWLILYFSVLFATPGMS